MIDLPPHTVLIGGSLVKTPYLCTIEYLSQTGWVVGHRGINLLDPKGYVDRLTARGKFGRCTNLDTGEVFVSPNVPDDPSVLVPSETVIPRLPADDERCVWCEGAHLRPHDGSCLL